MDLISSIDIENYGMISKNDDGYSNSNDSYFLVEFYFWVGTGTELFICSYNWNWYWYFSAQQSNSGYRFNGIY
jgi:hypothetical protein